MRHVGLGILLVIIAAGAAGAQGRGRTVIVPAPLVETAIARDNEGKSLVRVDGLPSGAVFAVDGSPVGQPGQVAGWVELAPGPHVIEIALSSGGTIRLTVVPAAESASGYQVVPRP